ncbi:RE1 [Symbiodinium sp. CCMP2592]|nr:RE1 [Symbiodinium sp. CCMP2592]
MVAEPLPEKWLRRSREDLLPFDWTQDDKWRNCRDQPGDMWWVNGPCGECNLTMAHWQALKEERRWAGFDLGEAAAGPVGSRAYSNVTPRRRDRGRAASVELEDAWHSWDWNWGSAWQGQSSWYYSAGGNYETRATPTLPELVPEFVQAWYLLQDAGLEQNEKNLVLTAIKGEMDLQKMAQELRTQCPEPELRRRDQQRRHHGYWGHTEGGEDSEDDEQGGPDMVFSAEQELNEEGYALWSSAASEAEEALAALQGARRTLKDARARQHQVKMNRKYFRGGPSGGRGGHQSTGPPRDDSRMTCLRCGKVGHRIANSPQSADYKKEPDAQAPFVCFATAGVVTEEDDQAFSVEAPTTQEAVLQGKCVLDSGATRSLGSAHAIEQVMRLSSGAVSHIDVGDCPKFGFGNSSEERCVSTVHFKVKAQGQDGTLKVHALSGGEGPILFSIEALRKLKAIVDYDSDMVVFRALNPKRLIQLEQSTSGHQIFPLTEDFYTNSVEADREVPGLMSYAPKAEPTAEFDKECDSDDGGDGSDDRQCEKSVTFPRVILSISALQNMADLTSAELRQALAQLGETPPAKWTKPELRLRLEQLTKEDMSQRVKKESKQRSPYEEMVRRMNAASKRKATLIEFCRQELNMHNLDSWTIVRIQHEAMKKIYEVAEADASDMVGFGIHGRLTYRELRSQQPGYVKWVKDTARTNKEEADTRLLRLARWLESEGDEEMIADAKKIDYKNLKVEKSEAKGKGYPSSSPATGSTEDPTMTMMKNMCQAIESLQSQVAELRIEPRRKMVASKEEYESEKPTPRGKARSLETKAWMIKPQSVALCGMRDGTMNRIIGLGTYEKGQLWVQEGYLREGWVQYFGMPRALRLDPAGSFRSQAVQDFCDRNNVYHDNIPADGHWQIGVCEQAIQGVKTVMTKLVDDDDQVTPEEALAQAVHVFNARDHVRGFSPVQHAFGRSPDITGRLLETSQQVPDELVLESATEEFERSARLRAEAEKAHAQWHMEQRITRALNSRAKPVYDFRPGELIYFWRSQESGQSRTSPGSKTGRFLGPARVLATETRREADGTLRPGSAVWCVRGRSLLKCCPEQLRHASEREELLEGLAKTHGEPETPWTFTKVAEEIGGNQYQDISDEKPEPSEWERSQDVREEVPPVRYRFRGKRAEPEPSDEVMEEPGESRTPSQPSRPRTAATANFIDHGERWTERVPSKDWATEAVQFWEHQDAAVEVEIAMPETKKHWEKAAANMQGFFVGALKRRAVEVSEKRLTPQELSQFKEAKAVEVKNFLAAEAFQVLPPHLRPNASQAIGMRWILTWKTREDGTRRAKARAVLLGYQDPGYEHRATTAPVMTRQSRQLLLQVATNRRWVVHKGDVSGAFLQGRQYPSDLYCIPCDEICQAMQLPSGTVTKLKRACYGLVDAPLEWYRTVHSFLLELGFERIWSDACVWTWRKNGVLRGVISGHVDDFLFAGGADDREWQEVLKQIQERFKWGDWDTGKFTQCGVQVEQTDDGFLLSQSTYLEDTPEIPLNSSRRKNLKDATTPWEQSKLRGVLGAISWHAQQVAPHLSAEVSLLLSEVTKSTVDTVVRTNQLLSHAKAKKDHQLRIHRFEEGTELGAYAWVDAGSQNRPDGGSTQGVLIGLAPTSLLQGEVCPVSVMAWHSNKIDRACRSPGAAETQAAINGEDLLYYLRYQLGELLHGVADAKDPDATVRLIPGCVISDSRNVFDKLQTEVVSIKGAERKSNIELLSLKEAQVQVRWVHSEAQLANTLTKASGGKELELFYRMKCRWRIVEDDQMRSARRRKTDGLEPLQQGDPDDSTVDCLVMCE